jgi:protein kinase-like protein
MDKPRASTASAAVTLQLEALWQQGQRPDPDALVKAAALSSPLAVAKVLAADQWQRWHASERIGVADYFARHPGVAADAAAALLLVYGEFLVREECGELPSAEEYVARFPQCAEGLLLQLDFHAVVEKPPPTVRGLEKAPGEPVATQPFVQAPPFAQEQSVRSLGEYRILREIGRGGMGVVYEAEQVSLGRHVALKVLPAAGLMNATFLERFLREAKAAAQLHHTNIVPVFGVGEADDVHFYAMQFIKGQSLDQVLGEVRRLRKHSATKAGVADQPGRPRSAAWPRDC